MNESATQLAFLRDPRLSAHAIGAAPAWLWRADATRILWANAVGAAIFDAPGPAVLARRSFDAKDRAAVQIARIAGTLPLDGASRLERLRGFGAGFGRALTCSCSQITLNDGTHAILVVARQAAGPSLLLAERVRRVVAEIEAPIAVFSAEGTLLHAATPALDRLAAATTLSFLGADALAADALRAGRASGPTRVGPLSIERIGTDPATALVAILPSKEASEATAAPESGREAATDPAHADVFADEPSVPEQSAPAVFANAEAASPSADHAAAPAPIERRFPLRFVWQMDAGGRFQIESGDFTRLTSPRTAEVLGRPWNEIAAALGLDPEGHVARAIATRDTWSGITIDWPVNDSDEHLSVELSGLPVFDRDRAFGGYRGFGVCRNARRISTAASMRAADSSSPQVAAPAADQAIAPPGDTSAAASSSDSIDVAGLAAESPLETKRPVMPLPTEERPVLTVVPAAKNVVPFRASTPAERTPSLSPVERKAFRELARQLTTRLQNKADGDQPPPSETDDFEGQPPAGSPVSEDAERNIADKAEPELPPPQRVSADRTESPPIAGALFDKEASPPATEGRLERTILDRLPIGVLVYRLDTLLYANRAFLDWTGHDGIGELTASGGLDNLFVEPGADKGDAGSDGRPLTVTTNRGDRLPADGRLFSAPWEGETAHVLMLVPPKGESPSKAAEQASEKASETALRLAEAESRELKSILDTATDGVLVLDGDGKIVSANRSAEALFGYDAREFLGSSFADLFAPESQRTALDYLDGLMRGGVARVLNDGREVIGRVRQGGLIPLFMTVGKLDQEKFCVVLRDLTEWKKTEEELRNAKREAERASAAKSDFLAKISHEIRTPLNAIIGFSEVMMGERFGPIANDRYREYLKDIHASGGHLVSLLNDLLDLSKIEAGKADLKFTSLSLNELTQQCVAIMQPQANQERIIIRTSLPPVLPQVVADARSVRQIVLNLLSNSIKFTGAGGQVIVSTALTDDGEVVLRVRDTGAGMSEKDVQLALEPFRQLATSARWGSGGTGLGLPLTKALVEANRASFAIKSAINAGTLVEISFPPVRVLA
jgi:PAS domain S-box-containing protein